MKKVVVLISILLIITAGCSWFKSAQDKMQEAKKDAKENVKESIKEGASGAIDKIFESDEEEAIAKAKEQYEILKSQGLEMSNGPCLSNEIIPDWVADVAHDPREDIDDLPENQCPAYREGKASHFVELDPDGNFIKAN